MLSSLFLRTAALGSIALSNAATFAQPSTAATHPRASQDSCLHAIYTAEDAWRRSQRGTSDPDHPRKILAQLPRVDAATQQADLKHWQGVLLALDSVQPAALSPTERINFQVFRAQLVGLIHAQTFREYERPANSDSTFWSDEEEVTRVPFKTADDYKNYIAQLNDLPRAFHDAVLELGYVPLPVLTQHIDAWIANGGLGPYPTMER